MYILLIILILQYGCSLSRYTFRLIPSCPAPAYLPKHLQMCLFLALPFRLVGPIRAFWLPRTQGRAVVTRRTSGRNAAATRCCSHRPPTLHARSDIPAHRWEDCGSCPTQLQETGNTSRTQTSLP